MYISNGTQKFLFSLCYAAPLILELYQGALNQNEFIMKQTIKQENENGLGPAASHSLAYVKVFYFLYSFRDLCDY